MPVESPIPKGPAPASRGGKLLKDEEDGERQREKERGGERGARVLEGVNPLTTAVIIVNNTQLQSLDGMQP